MKTFVKIVSASLTLTGVAGFLFLIQTQHQELADTIIELGKVSPKDEKVVLSLFTENLFQKLYFIPLVLCVLGRDFVLF